MVIISNKVKFLLIKFYFLGNEDAATVIINATCAWAGGAPDVRFEKTENLMVTACDPLQYNDEGQIDDLVAKHNVTFHWVKGHAGHPENERADSLAVAGIPR